MTEERLRAWVAGCSRLAARRPRLYRAGALAFAALGLGYVLFWVLLAFGLGLLFLFSGRGGLMKLGIGLLVLAVVLGRALRVKFSPLEGYRLTAEQAPALFAVLADLRAQGKVPPIAEVFLDGAFNASVVQRPRFGMLGGSRNSLIVGLPYLLALSADQFRAVLAHELGHLAGAHGRLGAWVYRVRTTWRQLFQVFERGEARLEWLFRPFVRWYAPRLDAYTYALRRAQEIEADAFSAAAAGAQNAAEALVVAAVLGAHLHESFWPAINRRPAQEPEPPVLHREMQLAFAGVPPATAHQRLTEALAEEANPFDSHPALAERLAALGVPVPALPPRPTETAAERYLGDGLAELTATLDRDWSRDVRPTWREAHQEAREQRARLAELDERHGRGEALDDDDAFARADLVEDHRDPAEALALLRALVARNPHHPRASFAMGRMLLARRDEAGIAHVERAMAHDPDAVTDGCQVIARYLRAVGRDAEAERYRERFEEADRAAEAARAARQGIDPGDRFAPHGLDEDDVASIVAQLRRIPGVKRAYLVRKELDDDGPPMFLLAFDRRRSLWRGLVMVSGGWWLLALLKDPTEKLRHRVAAGVQMPGESFVMALAPQNRATRERVRAVPGALILGTPTSEG